MGKKKPSRGVVDDDEYSIGVDLSDDRPLQDSSSMQSHDAARANKNMVNKKASGQVITSSADLKIDNPAAGADGEDEQVAVKKSKHKKSSRSHFNVSAFRALEEIEDNNDVAIDLEEKNHDNEEELLVSFSGKKKGSKKGGRKAIVKNDDFDAEFGIVSKVASGEEDNLQKISKPKNSGNPSVFGELEDISDNAVDLEENNQDVEVNEQVVSFSGNKNSSKSTKKVSNMFDVVNLDNDTQQVEEAVDEPVISFSGKKKSSKIAKQSVFTVNLLNDENERLVDDDKNLEDDTETITFFGRKKSSRNTRKIALDSSLAEGDNNKSIGTNQPCGEDENEPIGKDDMDVKAVKDDVDTSKKLKKNKKKSARTAKEEEDLDKILEELGAKPLAAPHAEQTQAPVEIGIGVEEEKEGQAEASESAASKKKKKKKEKEKEKKAAVASSAAEDDKAEDTKNKISEKKVPKHVREMQEQLARRKEAEERKKREEEEKLRKEEEERQRQEELERLAEEAKKRKKEREKEKILKKKQEGKLLTGKQKELQRRLEAMRNQILAQEGVALPSADTVTKRPKYERKKSKPVSIHFNDKVDKIAGPVDVDATEERTLDSETCIEVEKANEDSFSALSDERMAENGAEGEDEEDGDEWDTKSWDDAEVVALPLKSAFDEEEEVESLGKKVGTIKHTPATIVSVARSSTRPLMTNITAEEMTHLDSNQTTRCKNQEVVASKPKVQEIANSQESKAVEDISKKGSENLRSPICCILGHVDTGKTKLLDCIRGTNVQEGEAGGITQQIGATYFPAESIRERTKELKADAKLLVPGLLVIDTPGHESFTNLRSRGSGLCDIAILVVDIMHGLEPQTIESLNLLKMRNTEFIVALNKVDRLYGWKTFRNAPIGKSMKLQSVDVQNEFKRRLTEVITQFKEQGLNTELYYKNKEMGQTFSIVPTSAITGEGIPDLLLLLVQWTQKTMEKKLLFVNEVQCTVLEVKVDPGHGITIDVILVNGVLHAGDQIVVCGLQGPIVTTIRALLTPHPMKELRIKGGLLSHDQIKAAQGVKIAAQGLDHAIAGTGLHVVRPDDDLEAIMDAAMQDVKSVLSRIDKSGEGVCVQASTLGSLEALLEFLKSPAVKIPVSGISIGPVHKKDVMRASVMLERKKEYATILAFDVKVTPEARELAEEAGVKIFCADIIYHLFDQFKAYIDNLKEEKKKEAAEEAVFPCVLKIMPNCIFNKKDPIVLGVDVLEGLAKVGTPICVPSRDYIDIGRIASIEINHRQVDIAKKGQKVAVKIVCSNPEEQQKMYGRHFEMDDELVSHITRKSIDVLKANYREDLSIEEWKLVVKLKNIFKIQ